MEDRQGLRPRNNGCGGAILFALAEAQCTHHFFLFSGALSPWRVPERASLVCAAGGGGCRGPLSPWSLALYENTGTINSLFILLVPPQPLARTLCSPIVQPPVTPSLPSSLPPPPPPLSREGRGGGGRELGERPATHTQVFIPRPRRRARGRRRRCHVSSHCGHRRLESSALPSPDFAGGDPPSSPPSFPFSGGQGKDASGFFPRSFHPTAHQ